MINGHLTRMAALALTGGLLLPVIFVRGQSGDTFAAKLLQARYGLSVRNSQLAGTGAEFLKSAIAQSQFVLVGEEHGLAETPELWRGICNAAVPEGFHAMAIEESPLITEELERWANRSDGVSALADFQKRFGGPFEMYNTREEFAMLQQCVRAAQGSFRLWGLNQDALGAAGLILSKMMETKPGPEVTAVIQKLQKENADADKKALQTGRASDLFMLSANDSDLIAASKLVQKQGSARVQALFNSLLESHQINLKWPASADQRSQLMKRRFAQNYAAASRASNIQPKVLLKFGAYHIYRGWNPVHGSGIGNYVAEIADAQGTHSLHIRLMAVRRLVGGPSEGGQRSEQVQSVTLRDDPNARYLQPMMTNLLDSGWTMFDLRPLRQELSRQGVGNPDLAALVFGVDILIMVPEATPSTPIR